MSLPSAIDAEAFVLGCIIQDDLPLPSLSVSDFFEPKHQDFWKILKTLRDSEIGLDELSVSSAVRELKRPELIVYLNEVTSAVLGKTLKEQWIAEIKRTAALRRIQELGTNLTKHASDPLADPAQLLAYVEGTAKSFGATKKTGLEEMSLDALEQFDRNADPNLVIGKFRWLCKGGSMLLVSQSGVGKSSFAMQFIISLCIQHQKGFFGIEAQRPLRVVMLQAENDIGDVSEAFQDICAGMMLDAEQKDLLKQNFRVFRDTASVGKDFLARMKELIQLHQADVFVVDPLLSFAGIEVSDQAQMTEFLRHGVARVLEETGAVLIAVHHTTKPRSAKDKEGQTAADLAYTGAGASELVNYVREVGVLQRCQGDDPIFKFSLTKRRNRAGMKDINGEFSPEIYVRHARQNNAIRWEYSPAPEAQPEESSSVGSQTPSKSLKKVPQGRFNA